MVLDPVRGNGLQEEATNRARVLYSQLLDLSEGWGRGQQAPGALSTSGTTPPPGSTSEGGAGSAKEPATRAKVLPGPPPPGLFPYPGPLLPPLAGSAPPVWGPGLSLPRPPPGPPPPERKGEEREPTPEERGREKKRRAEDQDKASKEKQESRERSQKKNSRSPKRKERKRPKKSRSRSRKESRRGSTPGEKKEKIEVKEEVKSEEEFNDENIAPSSTAASAHPREERTEIPRRPRPPNHPPPGRAGRASGTRWRGPIPAFRHRFDHRGERHRRHPPSKGKKKRERNEAYRRSREERDW